MCTKVDNVRVTRTNLYNYPPKKRAPLPPSGESLKSDHAQVHSTLESLLDLGLAVAPQQFARQIGLAANSIGTWKPPPCAEARSCVILGRDGDLGSRDHTAWLVARIKCWYEKSRGGSADDAYAYERLRSIAYAKRPARALHNPRPRGLH